MGAEFDPNAPWNEVEPEEIERECNVWMAVTKDMPIPTTNYVMTGDPYDNEPDTSEVNWEDEFVTNCRDIPEILKALCDLVRKYAPLNPTRGEAKYISRLLKEAEGWEVDEMHIEEV